MPTERDYYDILGVPRNASSEDLKSAFRKLARQYHPDVNKAADAEERFKEINESYAVLSDPEKRSAYDRFGRAGLNGMGGVPDWSTIDFSDILEGFFGFGMGGGRQRRNAPRRGQDLSMQMQLTFERIRSRVEKKLNLQETRNAVFAKVLVPNLAQGVNAAKRGGRGESTYHATDPFRLYGTSYYPPCL